MGRTRTHMVVATLLVTGAAALGCTGTGPGSGMPESTVVALEGTPLQVEVADTPDERVNGLQDHRSLPDDSGMIFVWEEPAIRAFAMKDVSFAIDVIFIDENLRVVAIDPLDPGDTEPVESPVPVLYVVETDRGWASAHGVYEGSKLVAPGL